VVIIDNIFFIWIGCIGDEAIKYIQIWRSLAKDSSISIYYDSTFLLYGFYKSVFNKIYGICNETKKEDIIKYQDEFRNKIEYRVTKGVSFDLALIEEVRDFLDEDANILERELSASAERMKRVGADYDLIDISKQDDLFNDKFYLNIYRMELLLRGNPASASDILRLLIIYFRGGMYIDVDTLPSLKPIYGDAVENINCNMVDIIRSEYFLRAWADKKKKIEIKKNDISQIENFISLKDKYLLKRFEELSTKMDMNLLFLPPAHVYKDLISIAGLETQDEYNNNIVIAEKGSRLVRIILRELKARYKFLFKYGLDRGPNKHLPVDHYLSCLSNYRYDTLDKKANVTLFLTGPCLLLEVILGVAYEILRLEKSVSPLAVSYALRLRCVLIAFEDHTNYTPEHMKSSWMK
jgi:hypothetical protein